MAGINWLTVFIYLLVPAIAVVARRMSGSWYSPAAFFAAFWSVFAGLPLVARPIEVAPAGMLFLAGACAAVLFGAWIARRRNRGFSGYAPVLAVEEPPLLGWFIAACTVLGFVAVLLILASIPGARHLSPSGIASTIHQLAIARNAGTWTEPAVARVLTAATFLAALLSGVLIGIRKSGSGRWFSLAALLPSVTITVILTTKSSLLIPIALGVSAYLATSVATGRAPALTWRRFLVLASLLAVLVAAFIGIQMVRYAGWAQQGRMLYVVQLLWLDSFPYMGVFSSWAQANALSASLHPSLGQYTFAGAFDLLHIHTRVAGLYTDQVQIDGAGYNIYTAFRGLIEDFTVPGALLFLALVGFGAQIVYLRTKSGDLLSVGILAAFYAATLWSFVVDIFIYNTIVLAFLVLLGYLALASRPSFRRLATRFERPRGVPKPI
jgi:oligosaccharide repeat unit polymerase